MWSAEDRRIFQYQTPDGQVMYADPARVYRLLGVHTQGRFGALVREVMKLNPPEEGEPDLRPQEGTPEYAQVQEAWGLLAYATLRAFDLPPFDPFTGQGTLEHEARALLCAFTAWMHEKKS